MRLRKCSMGESISLTSSENASNSGSESNSGSSVQGQQIVDPTTGAVVRTTDIPQNEALAFVHPRTGNITIDADSFHKCLLLHLPPSLTAPSNLSAKDPVSGDTFIAFSRICVHLWCLVKYVPSDKLLECPCHGGEYVPGTGLYQSLPSASNQTPGMAIEGPPALQSAPNNTLPVITLTIAQDGTLYATGLVGEVGCGQNCLTSPTTTTNQNGA